MNKAAEEAAKDAQPTPCELARENDLLKQKVAALCRERDELKRERDAAVEAMEHIANSALFPCEYCTQDCTETENCKTGEAKFKWRGAQEDE